MIGHSELEFYYDRQKHFFSPQIRLAYSDGNHYDSVYTTGYTQSMAVCQGEIQYSQAWFIYKYDASIKTLIEHFLTSVR